ncbi:hypothetical protein BA190_09610 [Labrys sp. WJW]|uniref:helix-turn-helix transcriptional regulator n=1 Tax=Labrys sp. WJW TaxID=1737983 RepID=UPI00082A14BD|nr:hypothetical protein [Labrys sp. WJW]OCC05161.1 hypothetical protein BA190_09610 [Labrys sp. WJW]
MAAGPAPTAAQFLTPVQLSERWGGAVSVRTLERWRSENKGPAFVKLNGTVIYRIAVIEAYEAANTGGGGARK